MIEDTISGRRLIWVCHTDFKILSDTDDKAKEFIKTQLESWEEVLDEEEKKKKILKSIKRADCLPTAVSTTVSEEDFFVRIVLTFQQQSL